MQFGYVCLLLIILILVWPEVYNIKGKENYLYVLKNYGGYNLSLDSLPISPNNIMFEEKRVE